MTKWDTCTFVTPLDVFLFILQQLWVGTCTPRRVCKRVEHTILGRKVMVAVPVMVLVCMDMFPIYSCWKVVVRSR